MERCGVSNMKTLLEKIRTNKYKTFDPQNRYVTNYWSPDAVAVDIANVSEWLNHNKKQSTVELLSMCPQRLPFESMWLEWNQIMQHEDHTHPSIIGILLIDVEPKKEEEQKILPERGVFGFCFSEDPHNGTRYLCSFEIFSNDGGQTVSNIGVNREPPHLNLDEKQIEQMVALLSIYAIATLVFFSCKNIQLKSRKMNQKSRKKLYKETGIHIQDFHVIEVHKFMTKTESSKSKGGGPSLSTAHLVRGHFKKFGSEYGHKKLLGKFEGKYFWHPHSRGVGPVKVSDYRVWPPQDDHRKDCIIETK